MIRKINVKNTSLTVGHLNVGDDVATSKADIAGVLADTMERLYCLITLNFIS